jgi:hypothetical protein
MDMPHNAFKRAIEHACTSQSASSLKFCESSARGYGPSLD